MRKKETENLAFEIRFFERLIKDNPDYIEALIPLANAYTRIGNYKKGLTLDKKLARLRKDDATVFYNLSCSYSLLNMINESCTALKKAITLGYNDLLHLQKDSDLNNLRKDIRYGEIKRLLLAQLKQSQKR